MQNVAQTERGPSVAAAFLLVVLLGAGGVLAQRVQPAVSELNGLTAAQQERLEKVASASLFGQFRTSLSDYLWLKADKYMHRGVDLRGLTDQEKRTNDADGVSTHPDDPVKMKHTEETTVVPSRERDWRGHLGDIEREVTPYMDMNNHGHGEARETLPLFRLMTWSNPHFIRGYVIGWNLMAQDPKHLGDAEAFLREGEANNPQSIEIQNELGILYTVRKKEYDRAMPYLYQAIQLAEARDPSTLNEDEGEAWKHAYRWAVLNRRDAGDQPTARTLAAQCLKRFPEDVVCTGYLKQYGHGAPAALKPPLRQ
ncbi:MAG: hypothetical protein SFU56_08135 [Capsulimonadales bacterium]|nr:hypothetical protein [Capsulimonadales bacterium]